MTYHVESSLRGHHAHHDDVAFVDKQHNELVDLPEHWQPSSDQRILAWLGTLATLTVAALWVRDARTRARRP